MISTSTSRIKRPALRYHGGKFRLAPRLIALFPPHRVYTEAFGGGASVLMQKPRCYSEIYNDLDGEVVNVFRVLQSPKKSLRLQALLRVTPFAREEFELSYEPDRGDVERARRTIIRSFMGFSSDAISRTRASSVGFNTRLSPVMRTGFRWTANVYGVMPSHDWANYPPHVGSFCARLSGVAIENRDGRVILEKMDGPDTLHYVDPPYLMDVRKTSNGSKPEHRYRHEMTDDDHLNLGNLLLELKGMVIISGYPSALYDRIYRGWTKRSWTGKRFCSGNSTSSDSTRTECVWINPVAADRLSQRSLPLEEPTA